MKKRWFVHLNVSNLQSWLSKRLPLTYVLVVQFVLGQ